MRGSSLVPVSRLGARAGAISMRRSEGYRIELPLPSRLLPSQLRRPAATRTATRTGSAAGALSAIDRADLGVAAGSLGLVLAIIISSFARGARRKSQRLRWPLRPAGGGSGGIGGRAAGWSSGALSPDGALGDAQTRDAAAILLDQLRASNRQSDAAEQEERPNAASPAGGERSPTPFAPPPRPLLESALALAALEHCSSPTISSLLALRQEHTPKLSSHAISIFTSHARCFPT